MDKVAHQLLKLLGEYVTDHKKKLIDEVLTHRTRYFTVVLEDIYHSQNTNAVIRTCDCYGIQDVHIIESLHEYKLNPRVAHGASKWVNIIKYNETENNTATCFDDLRSKGYKILATSLDGESLSIDEVSIGNKTAFVFGTEMSGISDYARKNADGLVTIPMYGFTESLNISVSVAICLNTLVKKLFCSSLDWGLTNEEKNELKLHWFRTIVSRSEIIEKEFLKSLNEY